MGSAKPIIHLYNDISLGENTSHSTTPLNMIPLFASILTDAPDTNLILSVPTSKQVLPCVSVTILTSCTEHNEGLPRERHAIAPFPVICSSNNIMPAAFLNA